MELSNSGISEAATELAYLIARELNT